MSLNILTADGLKEVGKVTKEKVQWIHACGRPPIGSHSSSLTNRRLEKTGNRHSLSAVFDRRIAAACYKALLGPLRRTQTGKNWKTVSRNFPTATKKRRGKYSGVIRPHYSINYCNNNIFKEAK